MRDVATGLVDPPVKVLEVGEIAGEEPIDDFRIDMLERAERGDHFERFNGSTVVGGVE